MRKSNLIFILASAALAAISCEGLQGEDADLIEPSQEDADPVEPFVLSVDNSTSFGYESGLEYVIAYCAEDLNGVVGPVKFTKVTTTVVKPGPNPTMEIKATVSPDGKTISCEFISNEDSKQLKYYGSSEGSYQNLGLHKLLNDLREEYETR